MKLLKKLLSYFPSNVPVGMTEFTKWSDSIIDLTGPVADKDSMIWVISSTLINLNPQQSSVPKNHFVRTLRKAAASQIAGEFFRQIKQRQKEAEEAAKAAATAQQDKASLESGNTETKETQRQ